MSDLPASTNLSFVEALYARYLEDPDSVDDQWQAYFKQFQNGQQRLQRGPSFSSTSIFSGAGMATLKQKEAATSGEDAGIQQRAERLIRNYRVRGHIAANIDPLSRPKAITKELEPAYYGLSESDMHKPVLAGTMRGATTLGDVIQRLKDTYTRSIGAQFMHIDDLEVRKWLQERMENTQNRLDLSRDEQLRILTKLTDATTFEDFLQKKYVGAKSFSLKGAESLIPLMDLSIEKAGDQGVLEVVIGMAHRGRLNVLTNILNKRPSDIFYEYDDNDPELHRGGGDVKYHMGYSSDWYTQKGDKVHLSLAFNPSHLEYVNPVAMGRVRAKQDRVGDFDREQGMLLLIHGDAAFAGEGVVQETLNMSELLPYYIGGTLHVVLNNQIGFTTRPEHSRSTTYATDVAKMLQSPIFHVNGEDPEAVAQVVNLAMDFRRTFQRDVVIDMYCFRRFGHNEGDEPAFTQPLMYKAIKERVSVRESYISHLQGKGISQAEAFAIEEERKQQLENQLEEARSGSFSPEVQAGQGLWSDYVGGFDVDVEEVDTSVDRTHLINILDRLRRIPSTFHMHPKLKRLMDLREQMAKGGRPLDWASAEALAIATLAVEGARVRLTGQDVERGTFSHRHAVLHDAETGAMYHILRHLDPHQAPVDIYNSPLSEVAVLGFEYGYSLDYPDGLIIWEAQFGDFNNAAQVIIDQFIVSGEDKWKRLSGLVMLLPHGFEGQGPEHSSARLERFLDLAAEDNLQIVQPTTPAQLFHLLRRQVVRPYRKPLIVMTPKSLLRHPEVVSELEEFSEGRFERILNDTEVDQSRCERILLCSGKIYYDLNKKRRDLGQSKTAILRLEQLYPLSDASLLAALEAFPAGTPVYWVQEEPQNMGAWMYLRARFGTTLLDRHPLGLIARPESASPATGSGAAHRLEQEELMMRAFNEVGSLEQMLSEAAAELEQVQARSELLLDSDSFDA